MHGQFRPPDHSRGDANTVGGYAAVHERPAAFEAPDGFSYSVEILTEETGDIDAPWGAFLLFVKWARIGAQTPEGHLETDYLARGDSADAVHRRLGAMPLVEAKRRLDALVAGRAGGTPDRRWWGAMRDEGNETP